MSISPFQPEAPYLCWKRTRSPRVMAVFKTRRAAWLEFSGPELLAANSSRSRCVLRDGCPVLSLHFSFGFAPHMGQRTDNICPNVSFPDFTPLFISIANLRDDQSCSLGMSASPKREVPLGSRGMIRHSRQRQQHARELRRSQSAPRPPSFASTGVGKCNEAAC